jgi:hypothetical protein
MLLPLAQVVQVLRVVMEVVMVQIQYFQLSQVKEEVVVVGILQQRVMMVDRVVVLLMKEIQVWVQWGKEIMVVRLTPTQLHMVEQVVVVRVPWEPMPIREMETVVLVVQVRQIVLADLL